MNAKDKTAVDEVMGFLKAFVDYHIDETTIESAPTDAQMLLKNIPVLERLLTAKPKPKPKPKHTVKTVKPDYGKLCETDNVLRDFVYTQVRNARESVNPNYKYCVWNDDKRTTWLTDDLDAAMRFASTQSKSHTYSHYLVLKIVRANDGTYRTVKECFYSNGEYYDGDKHCCFLHYDYIASISDEILKL
jgi:hypothetical protein